MLVAGLEETEARNDCARETNGKQTDQAIDGSQGLQNIYYSLISY
jgi:hypothetical protein